MKDYSKKMNAGFTLIKLMFAVAIVAILVSIALPTYRNYVLKNKVKTAESDLVALSLVLENQYQRTLAYNTTITAATATTAATETGAGNAWYPAQAADFTYTVSAISPMAYTVLATATSSGLSGCVVSLTSTGTRNFNGSNPATACLQTATTW